MLTERFDRFFKSDDEKIAEAESILSLMKDSPELQERARQRDEKRLTRIRQLLAERDEINRVHAETMPVLIATRDQAQAKEKRAAEALQAATRERVNAEHARAAASGDFSLKISQIESEIRKRAPREIDEFIYEMVKADEKARLEHRTEIKPGPVARIIGRITKNIVESNGQAIGARRQAIKAAITEAEAMKLQALALEDIAARLAELKAGIPQGMFFEQVDAPFPDTAVLR
jgi:hypothetical protein